MNSAKTICLVIDIRGLASECVCCVHPDHMGCMSILRQKHGGPREKDVLRDNNHHAVVGNLLPQTEPYQDNFEVNYAVHCVNKYLYLVKTEPHWRQTGMRNLRIVRLTHELSCENSRVPEPHHSLSWEAHQRLPQRPPRSSQRKQEAPVPRHQQPRLC